MCFVVFDHSPHASLLSLWLVDIFLEVQVPNWKPNYSTGFTSSTCCRGLIQILHRWCFCLYLPILAPFSPAVQCRPGFQLSFSVSLSLSSAKWLSKPIFYLPVFCAVSYPGCRIFCPVLFVEISPHLCRVSCHLDKLASCYTHLPFFLHFGLPCNCAIHVFLGKCQFSETPFPLGHIFLRICEFN